jgi:hypothetical protein
MNTQEYQEIQNCKRFVLIASIIVVGLIILYARLKFASG